MRNSGNIGRILLGTLRELIHIGNVQNICNLSGRQE